MMISSPLLRNPAFAIATSRLSNYFVRATFPRPTTSMTPNNRAASTSSPASASDDVCNNDDGGVVVSRIYLVRHGARQDYADPSWLDRAARHGALATDPPLSALGHRQARETAAFLRKITTTTTTRATTRDGDDGDGTGDGAGGCSSNGGGIDAILVSPYLRTIQTAAPTSDLLGVPLQIEDGLSESHATDRNLLASNDERFAYFPQIDPAYDPLLRIVPTLGHSCRRTGMPCESFAGDYVRRMGAFAHLLERAYRGRNVALFSHAASVALAAALLRRSMRGMTFAPCGVYRLVRVGDGPWTMAGSGHDNSGHATENCSTTHPWGFEEVHFDEVEKRDGRKGDYCGRSEGVDLDYFVVDDDDDDGRDNSEHKSKM